MRCEHGRDDYRTCPHCMGIGTASPTEPDWRDTACENIERALARAPFADLIADDFFVDNPNGSDVREELNNFLAAYERVVKERDELRAEAKGLRDLLEGRSGLKGYAELRSERDKAEAELAAEKERVKLERGHAIQMDKEAADSRAEVERLRAALERIATATPEVGSGKTAAQLYRDIAKQALE